ncbi:hypothetical protein BDK51DRAFT_50473 [Blyttiomyces helicus]|uniref:Uncharacterized protein n=1 Tax=Blyttiomyces helicus TaxID=388810 RepID=A0A4P9VTS1_9FUNG|nr:hypothetical protein BDK51DRAFT_50473 [Blyttiomyces helicus]|eukprot:RKO82939.1 hypothetical protein BDK51DRAFT_50473 [Blyttiomyces helicus]
MASGGMTVRDGRMVLGRGLVGMVLIFWKLNRGPNRRRRPHVARPRESSVRSGSGASTVGEEPPSALGATPGSIASMAASVDASVGRSPPSGSSSASASARPSASAPRSTPGSPVMLCKFPSTIPGSVLPHGLFMREPIPMQIAAPRPSDVIVEKAHTAPSPFARSTRDHSEVGVPLEADDGNASSGTSTPTQLSVRKASAVTLHCGPDTALLAALHDPALRFDDVDWLSLVAPPSADLSQVDSTSYTELHGVPVSTPTDLDPPLPPDPLDTETIADVAERESAEFYASLPRPAAAVFRRVDDVWEWGVAAAAGAVQMGGREVNAATFGVAGKVFGMLGRGGGAGVVRVQAGGVEIASSPLPADIGTEAEDALSESELSPLHALKGKARDTLQRYPGHT